MTQVLRSVCVLMAALVLSGCASMGFDHHPPAGATPELANLADGTTIRYMQYVPRKDTGILHMTEAPVLVFLHGSGEAGADVTRVMGPGPWTYAHDHTDFPFIILAPQQPTDSEWDPKRLKQWLDIAESRIPADKHRIYLTGLSLGGGGAWDFAIAYPKLFAAVAPVSGYSNLKTPCVLKDNHIWAFHGEIDDVVPIKDEQALVDQGKACGIDIKYTIYPGGNHNAWDATYANPDLYSWFLAHKN